MFTLRSQRFGDQRTDFLNIALSEEWDAGVLLGRVDGFHAFRRRAFLRRAFRHHAFLRCAFRHRAFLRRASNSGVRDFHYFRTAAA